jgi:hypothetical protein
VFALTDKKPGHSLERARAGGRGLATHFLRGTTALADGKLLPLQKATFSPMADQNGGLLGQSTALFFPIDVAYYFSVRLLLSAACVGPALMHLKQGCSCYVLFFIFS